MKLFTVMQTAFENFDNTVRTYLAKTFNNLGLQYTHSQIFGVIFDGMKGIMQNIMFYIEDALTEQNIYTASRKQSIYSLAKLSGFEPSYGNSANGSLLASLHISNGLDSNSSKIYLKNHSTLTNKTNGLTYSVILPTDYYVFDLEKPLIKHEISVVQGIFVNNNYVSKGLALETISIKSAELFDMNYVSVKVDGKEYDKVGNLYDMTENGEQYMLNVGFDNGFEISFGDGIHGRKLTEGQTVQVEYLKHGGLAGNISPNEESSFIFGELGKDTLGNDVNINDFVDLKVQTCLSGGTNSDSISFVRKMIGTNSRSSVLASEDNFKLFFKRFSFIGHINCWSESNSMNVNITCLRNFSKEIKSAEDYFNISVNDLLLTDNQKRMINNTLENSKKAFAGVSLKFQDPVIRKFAAICYVKVDNSFDKDIAKVSIRKILGEYFFNSIEDTQFISKSKIINKIHNEVDCVKSIDIDFISDLNESAYKNGYYYKYMLAYSNSTYRYVTTKVMYESSNTPGLDMYGNISLESKLEIPVLKGGFYYYPNKTENDVSNGIVVDSVQIYFI